MLTNRKKVLAAAAGSALIHVVVMLAVAYAIALRPPVAPSAPPPEPIHLEIVKTPPIVPALASPTPEHRVVDTSGMKPAEHPPADPKFQSDQDTAAASEGPASGDQPLPTQDGRAAPTYAFNTSLPVPASEPVAQPPVVQPPTAPLPPVPRREVVPERTEDPAPTLVRNDLSVLDPAAAPSPEEVNPYDPSFRSTAPPPPTPVRRPASTPAYRPLAERTASSGNITTRGAASVDAVSTPFGRYQKAVLASIRVVWDQQIQARSDIASLGTVKVHFVIDRTGHVHTPRIISNSSNEALAAITVNSIVAAQIPPIPPELVESMDGAMLNMEVNFECL